MKLDIDDLSKEDLKKLHAFIITLFRYNNFHSVNNMSVVKKENNWIVNLNNVDYINEDLNNIIIDVLRRNNFEYYLKLLNNNIPGVEMQEYITHHNDTKSR